MKRNMFHVLVLAMAFALMATVGFATETATTTDQTTNQEVISQQEIADNAVLETVTVEAATEVEQEAFAPVFMNVTASWPIDFSEFQAAGCTSCNNRQCFMQCGGGECVGNCCVCW